MADLCILQNVLIDLYKQTHVAYKYSVLSEQLNNPTPSFKEPNLIGIA